MMPVESIGQGIDREAKLFFEEHKPPTDLIFDDGAEMESNRHRIAMTVLIRSLEQGFAHRNDFFVGGNMFIYYSVKKDIYEQVFKTPDYFVFDPFDPNSLQGWCLDASRRYQPLVPNERGWLWCETLGFWLGTWEGIVDRETAVWVRFFDEFGNLVLLPEEAAQQQAEAAQQQAEQERQRADRLAARLRELGEDPNALNQ